MIAAHRGGGDNNPENTLKAFIMKILPYGCNFYYKEVYLQYIKTNSI